MKRPLLVTFAVVAYAWFLADIVWSIAFLADAGGLGISHGASTPTLWAVLINLSLLGVFAMHHSVMAREGAKRRITRVIPAAAERSTYVLVAVALLALVLWVWRPIGGGGTVWDVSAQPWQLLLWLGYGLGWLVAVAATFMIDHADFVGLRQAASRPGHYRPPVFREQWLYAWVRHPLMLGLLIAFWLTPRMSLGHLLFAAASTAYIVIGIRLEEGALRRRYGSSYADYATRVPALIPGPRRAMRSRATEVTRWAEMATANNSVVANEAPEVAGMAGRSAATTNTTARAGIVEVVISTPWGCGWDTLTPTRWYGIRHLEIGTTGMPYAAELASARQLSGIRHGIHGHPLLNRVAGGRAWPRSLAVRPIRFPSSIALRKWGPSQIRAFFVSRFSSAAVS